MALMHYRTDVAAELPDGTLMTEEVRMTLVPCSEYQDQQVKTLICPKTNDHIPAFKTVMEHFDVKQVSFDEHKMKIMSFRFIKGRGLLLSPLLEF